LFLLFDLAGYKQIIYGDPASLIEQ
jgi:hypothetical protein